MKTCAKCKVDKDRDQYYKRGEFSHAYCKPCYNLYTSDRRKTRAEVARIDDAPSALRAPGPVPKSSGSAEVRPSRAERNTAYRKRVYGYK